VRSRGRWSGTDESPRPPRASNPGAARVSEILAPPPNLPARSLAPAKVNLGLFLGPTREQDGKHELVTVMQSISLADELTLEPLSIPVPASAPAPAPVGTVRDEVVCPGVPGAPEENLAARALAAFRAVTGWDAPPLRLRIVKRIPVAAGLGGGSADAAAALRLAVHASGLGDERLLRRLGAALGADVPAQIAPGRWLAGGAGELLEALPDPNPATFGLLLLPAAVGLSTAAVYAEADRLGLARSAEVRQERRRALRRALELSAAVPATSELLENDLARAAISLCPEIAAALSQARDVGAEIALVSGSGPTVLGLFPHANGLGRAERAAAGLASERSAAGAPAPICATPVDAAFARVTSA
jgi:4-diphosphocytidyl-2-C-methyl-D-erythritol kinase